jgi:Flp pilus assembly pilin Flp
MKHRFGRRNGQTMVEYIIIVVLIAVSLIVLFGKFSKAVGTKVAAATSALDKDAGGEAASEVDKLDSANRIKNLDKDGNFGN